MTEKAAPANPKIHAAKRRGGWAFVRDIVVIVVIALLVSFLVKSFLVRSFYIPSGSMENTLQINDRILVDEITPRFTGYQRGDVVVFRDPGGWLPPTSADTQRPWIVEGFDWLLSLVGLSAPDSDDHLIKRVIGLPGDRIGYHDHQLTLNGQPVPYRLEGRYIGAGKGMDATGATELTEGLPGRPHYVLRRDDVPFLPQGQGEGDWIVPPGHYFVMGDNRDNSEDSRFWGFLPEANLRGKAFMVWMNFDKSADHWVDVSRIGTRIP